ncbi:hypothetical protein CERZMDRAFT_96675 [Cercospora zeae-maydis SCOH1-5]|uniref:MARVEL domain-containing protein n=1 Tax=Cercospora zeae-maydis SCOH1-5 TaxID=717836 RepID=A0A6A6FHS3_9PEZI|nr:hypothetical protein CERZMDRAFT_96675 [Cercospora zeae-maydis SCOH1-5]
MADTCWRGWSSGVRWVLVAIFVISLVTWAMGCAFTERLAGAELRTSPTSERISSAEVYFYAAGFPMATMLAAAIDFALHTRGWLSPIVSIIWSLIAFGIWLFVLTMWGVTEYSPDTGGWLPLYVYRDEPYGSNLYYPRIALGSVAAILALVQLSFASRAVELERKERKSKISKLEHA